MAQLISLDWKTIVDITLMSDDEFKKFAGELGLKIAHRDDLLGGKWSIEQLKLSNAVREYYKAKVNQ